MLRGVRSAPLTASFLGYQRNIPRHAVVGVSRPDDATLGDHSKVRDGWRRPVTSRFGVWLYPHQLSCVLVAIDSWFWFV